jgi:hypothetical protein
MEQRVRLDSLKPGDEIRFWGTVRNVSYTRNRFPYQGEFIEVFSYLMHKRMYGYNGHIRLRRDTLVRKVTP